MAQTDTARTMTLEELAAITAALQAGLPRRQVLAEAGFSEAAWRAAQEQWLSTLADEASRGKLWRSKRCVALVGAEEPSAAARARKARRPPAGPHPVPPAPPLAPRLTTAVEKVLPAAPSEPSLAPLVTPEGALDPGATITIDVSPFAARADPLPFAKGAPMEPRPASTIAIDMSSLPALAEALPFAKGEPRPASMLDPGSTIAIGVSPFAARADPLPFVKGETSPPAPASNVGASTIAIDVSSIPGLGDALPFADASKAGNATAPPREARRDDGALPFAAPARGARKRRQKHETMAFPAVVTPPEKTPPASSVPMETAPLPPLPSQGSGASMDGTITVVPEPAPHERFGLSDYANLCAGVRMFPAHVPWIQSQFGLTPEGWAALHARWQERLQRDPALKAAWERLIVERMPYWKR